MGWVRFLMGSHLYYSKGLRDNPPTHPNLLAP